jgi:hypothetical protein
VRSLLAEEAERAAAARRDLDNAVSVVVSSDPAKLAAVADFFRAGRHLLHLARILKTLGINARGVEALDFGLVLRIGDVVRPGSGGDASLYTPDPEWAAALAALREDAAAELPGLPAAEDADAGDGAAKAA